MASGHQGIEAPRQRGSEAEEGTGGRRLKRASRDQIIEPSRSHREPATAPFKVIQQMMKHPLTDVGLKRFLDDREKSQNPARQRARPGVALLVYQRHSIDIECPLAGLTITILRASYFCSSTISFS